jgi:lipid-A-disaccharide synthase
MIASGAAPPRPLTIMLGAGEPAGDQRGAELMSGLAALAGHGSHPEVRIVGVGGTAMTRAGLQSLFPLDATSVMGLREVVPRIPQILSRVRAAADFARRTRPDLVVLIDSPDFTHRIARRLKRLDPTIRTANFAPPQVWASRPKRAERMAQYMDAVLTLLPFEAPHFARHGIDARFVGYPVLERARLMKRGDAFRAAHDIPPKAPLLAVLPGSRRNEIRFLLPVFREAVSMLARDIPDLRCVMPTIGHVAPLVRQAAADWPTPVVVVEGEDDKFAAFDAADAALAVSGTVTVELALSRTPMVVAYRMGALTYQIAKRFVEVPYIVLVNLILGREAVPEFIQERATPQALATEVKRLLTDARARAQQIRDLDAALKALGEGGESPSLRAARAVLELAARAG